MNEIKLRQLVEADPEYGEMLRHFFESEGVTDYLDMTFEDFRKYWWIKFERLEKRAKELFLEKYGVKPT